MVLSLCCEAIKKEEELSIAPSKMNIYIRQDALLFVRATSSVVAVVSMNCQFVFGQFFLILNAF